MREKHVFFFSWNRRPGNRIQVLEWKTPEIWVWLQAWVIHPLIVSVGQRLWN